MNMVPSKGPAGSGGAPSGGAPGPAGGSPADPAAFAAANGHAHCLVCGHENPWSLRLSFEPDGEGVRATLVSDPRLQGYAGVQHGGVTATLLDAAMTHCLFHKNVRALTADLHVRYVHAIPSGAAMVLTAVLTGARPPLYRLRAELRVEGRLMAWSEAKFLPCKE